MADADDAGVFSKHERAIIAEIERSPVWQRIRDWLCYEREMLYQRLPEPNAPGADRLLWLREGELRQVQRLLREGPRLGVYYDRYLREQEEKGQTPIQAPRTPPPGEDPEVM